MEINLKTLCYAKAPNSKIKYTVPFHLYKVQEQETLTDSHRKQIVVCLRLGSRN